MCYVFMCWCVHVLMCSCVHVFMSCLLMCWCDTCRAHPSAEGCFFFQKDKKDQKKQALLRQRQSGTYNSGTTWVFWFDLCGFTHHLTPAMCVCVCVCVFIHTHTHTHTNTRTYTHTHTHIHNITTKNSTDALWTGVPTITFKCVHLLQNVFSCYRMYSLAIECILSP